MGKKKQLYPNNSRQEDGQDDEEVEESSVVSMDDLLCFAWIRADDEEIAVAKSLTKNRMKELMNGLCINVNVEIEALDFKVKNKRDRKKNSSSRRRKNRLSELQG